MKRQLLLLCCCALLGLGTTSAQVSLQNGTTTYTIDFDASLSGVNAGAFTGGGFTANPAGGQLDADAWATTGLSDGAKNFGAANTSGDHARGSSNGGVSTGGLYGFDLGGGNRALGIQPTGSDWTPGTISLRIVNNSSSVINDMDVAYTVYVRNDQGRGSSFNFSYSFDNSSYTSVTSANYTSPQAAGGTAWNPVNRAVSLGGLALAPGASFYLRWAGSDVNGSGSRDEFALDDIVITAAGSTNPCTEPAAQPNSLSFGTVTANSVQATFTASAADKFLVVQSTNASLGAAPVDGTLYTAGSTLGNGEVLQMSNSTAINSLGLNSSTTYYYFLFAVNDNCSGGPDYRNSSPLTGSVTTTQSGTSNYYAGIGNETCADLKTALANLIDNHTVVSYSSLWTHYQTTDDRLNDAGNQTIVWDMYSDNPTGSENEFTFVSEQCGTYQSEGDCYNREHTFPKSWWGGSTSVPQYSDIFTVIPADGWINGVRNNNPYGEIQAGTETQITNNGSALGSSSISIPGYSGSVFEPIDAYKGDLARAYFYMATRYEADISGWENFTTESNAVLDGTSYPAYEPWMIDLLLSWHNSDPVDQKEIDRNEAVYGIQGNRNPFIDHPEYAALIWDNCGSGGGDTQAPSSPTNLTAANTTETTTDLNWTAATDNVGVVGYRVYQDGNLITTTSGTSTTVSGLTASTTYLFYVTAYDAAGNTSAASNNQSVTTDTPPGGPTVLSEGYFETGWDGWQDGGNDCSRYSGSRSPEGSFSIQLRDNSGTASAMTSPAFDLQAFATVRVDFSFYANSMENGEDFWLRYYNGSNWQTVATFTRGVDFNNGVFYTGSVSLDAGSYNFANNARFRFQCDASGNNDQIYMDEIVITGETGGSALVDAIVLTEAPQTKQPQWNEVENPTVPTTVLTDKVNLYPNPATDFLHIDLRDYHSNLVGLHIFNSLGQRVRDIPVDESTEVLRQSVSDLPGGIYFLRITSTQGTSQTLTFYVK